jgi:aminoglycoside phosphotransferase family enzyme/predicted kinase
MTAARYMGVVADQSETIAFLRDRLRAQGVEPRLVTTHASLVFLGRERAIKLKRAVRFPFLDFSTPQRRLALCRRELELNRRTAPALYLAACAITRAADGGLEFDGAGELVDAVVTMRRFADADLLDARAQAGDLPPDMMTRLARRLAAFHADAAPDRTRGGAAAMARVLALDEEALRGAGLFGAEETNALTRALRETHARLAPLLDARRAAGKVRRCHGDLTLKNICVHDGEATPFDCLEFDEDLATIDVLYDLAFLLMDLWLRERRDLANLVFNRYLDAAEETGGLPLMPFFMTVRATVRAHVTAAQAKDAGPERAGALRDEARRYFDLARMMLVPVAPRLVALGGFSGSGKSTAAAALAPALGAAPGARVLSSDRIRKALHGVDHETRLPREAYRPDISRAVYERQREAACATLAAGCAVVADAVFDRVDSRAGVERVARETGVAFDGFWLDAPLAALAPRVEARAGDASDATVAVLKAQAEAGAGEIGWRRIDASRDAAAIARALCAALGLDRDADASL